MADKSTEQAARAADELESLQARLDAGPPPIASRNINVDVHQGHTPQRPYARIEDQMARLVSGWQSHEQLLASLPERERERIVRGDDGAYYRVVTQGTGVQVARDGVLYDQVRTVRRGIALDQRQAKAATAAASMTPGGLETDYWNGFTWMRGGFKPELDFPALLADRQAATSEVELVPASEQDQALYRAGRARGAAEVARAEAATSVAAMSQQPQAGRKKD